ncbi:MAG: mRNA surveillance protein pelota [Promethearchaeota archaeon]|nr:MAG: mRNA surveillance protein pelota [Candidatus Lokiarchaeota archaeon]
MKIMEFDKKKQEMVLKTESLNDLWALYNVIGSGDKVSAQTHRRVVLREGSKGERKPMQLTINVESLSFHEFSNRLRIKGTILEGPDEYVSFGSYHTLNIKIGKIVSIIKEQWLKSEIKRIKQLSIFESNFLILMIAIETGLATIVLVSNYSNYRIATIKKTIPGKRYEQRHRNKAYEEFFSAIIKIIEENVKSNNIDLIVICGPGSTREHLLKAIQDTVINIKLPPVENIHASSGTESAILETLKSDKLSKLKNKVKIIQEVAKIEEIFRLFSTDPDLIAIGFDEVTKAAELGAIKELFCSDTLIRGVSKDNKMRIENLLNLVEKSRAIINILSSEHLTGQQIIDLGELVAILRYKI